MWDPYAEVQKDTLDNGLCVYTAHWLRSWQKVEVVIHAGAQRDPIGREGTAHFTEHVVSENGIMPQKKIRKFFGDLGGSVDLGLTSYIYTTYSFLIPGSGKVLRQALDIFSSFLLGAKLRKSFKREKGAILSEYYRKLSIELFRKIHESEKKMLYGDLWPSRLIDITGTPQSIERITRRDLQEFYDQYYRSINMSLIFVGNLKCAQVLSLVRGTDFAKLRGGKRVPRLKPIKDFPELPERLLKISTGKYGLKKKNIIYKGLYKLPGNIDSNLISAFCYCLEKKLYEELRTKRGWLYKIGVTYVNLCNLYELQIISPDIAIQGKKALLKIVDEVIQKTLHDFQGFNSFIRQQVKGLHMLDIKGDEFTGELEEHIVERGRVVSLKEQIEEHERLNGSSLKELAEWLRPERRLDILLLP